MDNLSKECRICGCVKPLFEFYKKHGTENKLHTECKLCTNNIIQKKYRDIEGFKEKQKEYDKKRYLEKREKILENKKLYHIEHREEILKKKSEYRKNNNNFNEWRKNNLDIMSNHQSEYRKKYPHIIAWRSVLYSTLKRLNTLKENHTIDMLGYSALELKEHIEKQFLSGMTWENHGEWHIDHIYPVSKFNENSSIKEVCALSNLQPLWEFDNLSKGNKT